MPWFRRRKPSQASHHLMFDGLISSETGLRVVFADDRARSRLGGGVIDVAPAALAGRLQGRKHAPQIDVVVASAGQLRDSRIQHLIDTAKPAAVVTVGPEPAAGASTGRRPVHAPPAINMAELNPVGFRRNATNGPVLAHFTGSHPPRPLLEMLRTRWGGGALDPDAIEAMSADDAHVGRYDARGMIEHPELHPCARDQADWVLTAVAQGIPVIGQLSGVAAELLDADLVKAIDEGVPSDLADIWQRDALSARQRRAALRRHGAPHVWRAIAAEVGLRIAPPPSVSVILASNRRTDVLEAAKRFAAFRYPSKELVVGLHGEGFPESLAGDVRAAAGPGTKTLAIPSTATLGEALNRLTNASSGDLVSKMDDDDLYDTSHLADLVDALRYSGATLVGKGSEFVYLEEIDTTIRRLPNGVESRSRSIGGGTLMIERLALRSIGGWQCAPRAVDQRLMDDVIAAGGRVHRTHGYGFILARRRDGHTWDSGVDYFLRSSVGQWQGLSTTAAGFE